MQRNGNSPGIYYSKVHITENGAYPNVSLDFSPVLCNQCTLPRCVDACESGASQILDNGIIIVDRDLCIDCTKCIQACPYEARVLIEEPEELFPEQGFTAFEEATFQFDYVGTSGKCDFCLSLLEEGNEPACVHTCVGRARIFGDLEDSASEIAKILASEDTFVLNETAGTEPNVYYFTR